MRRPVIAVLALAGLAGLTSAATAAVPPPPAPYRNPTFTCHVQHFGNGQAPNPAKTTQSPLCVDYDKRDITADDGGAIRFLAAEPDRFAVAGKCQYWQQDHWSIQLDHGYGPIIRWDGSYWWDLHRGLGAAVLRHLTIAGQPVGAWQAAAALETVSPALAAMVRKYGTGPSGGGGMTMTLPSGLRACH